MSHQTLLEANGKLILLCTVVDGNESLFNDLFTKVREYSSLSFKALATKSLDGVVKLLRGANSALVQAHGTNQMRINNVKGFVKLAVREEKREEVKLSKALLEQLTFEGKVDDILPSATALINTLSVVDKHRLDLEAFYQKELSYFSSYKQVKTTEDAVSLLKKLDSLTYPGMTLPHKDNSMLTSDPLPGGKHILYTPSSHHYKLDSQEVKGEATSASFSTDNILKLLGKLEDVDHVYKACHKANDNYISYLNKYNTVVKEAFNHIDGLKGDISSSLIRDLMSRLEGNFHIFSFYTSFLPKVMNYVDSYMVNTTNYLSKQFN